MESFGWEDTQVDISTPCLWSSPQHEIEKRLMMSNSNLCVTAMDSAADSGVAKSGSLTTWGEALAADFCNTSPPLLITDKPYGRNLSEGDLTAQFGVENHAPLYQNGNSSLMTETSVDRDVFSLIFSDCKNLSSFHSASAVSSGESDDNGPCNAKDRPERVSLHSSDQYAISVGRVKHAEDNPNPAKRSSYDQKELKTCSSASFGQAFQNGSPETNGTGFHFISEVIPPKAKKPRSEKCPSSSNISFQLQPSSSASSSIIQEPDPEAIAQMKEMIYRAAAFRPVNLGLEAVERPKRKNVKISSDPQTVAARQRRERISERIRILQKLVPGGSKMDTASMLEEAASYLKFLRSQIKALESIGQKIQHCPTSTNIATNLAFSSLPFYHSFPMQTHFPLNNPTHIHQQ